MIKKILFKSHASNVLLSIHLFIVGLALIFREMDIMNWIVVILFISSYIFTKCYEAKQDRSNKISN